MSIAETSAAPANKLVHFGVGAFHRGHQAYFVHEMNKLLPVPTVDSNLRWGYIGVNLRSDTREVVQQLRAQNCEYHLKTADTAGEVQYTKIQSITRVEDASMDSDCVETIFGDPTVKVLISIYSTQ